MTINTTPVVIVMVEYFLNFAVSFSKEPINKNMIPVTTAINVAITLKGKIITPI